MEIKDIKGINTRQVLYALITLVIGGGAGVGLEFNFLTDTISDKVKEYAAPAINKKVYAVLDSTLSIKKISFRERLADELRIPKDSIVPVFARWYMREKGITNVGIFIDRGRVLYRHIDSQVYVPAYSESQSRWYFLDPLSGETFWCL